MFAEWFENVMTIGLIGSIVLMLITFAFYFLPFIVALIRGHHNTMAIFVLNFLFGWTLLGWAIALVWSFTVVIPKRKNPQIENAKKKEFWRRLPLGMVEFLIEIGLFGIDDSDEYILCFWTRNREFWRHKPFSGKLDYLQQLITRTTKEQNLQKKANDFQIMRGILEGDTNFPDSQKANEKELSLFWELRREIIENHEECKVQLSEALWK